MTKGQVKVLLIGYGNPGRLDDGLGPRLAELVAAQRPPPHVRVESNYQLNIEDAALIAEHDVVIFADAHVSCPDPFIFEPIQPAAHISFSTHSIDPASLLALAQETFGAKAVAYALGIRGHEFNEYAERLSDQAQRNLRAAVEFLLPLLTDPNTSRFAAARKERQNEPARQTTVI